MDEKDKQLFNQEGQHTDTEQPQAQQDGWQTKRHYYGFGEKVSQLQSNQNQDEYKPRFVEVEEPQATQTFNQYNETKVEAEVLPYSNQHAGSSFYAPPMPITNVEQASTKQGFKVTEKKRGKGKLVTQYFLMFIASAIVLGSFMFLSDKLNWFTGNQVASSQQNTSSSSNPPATTEPGRMASYLEDRPDNISELFRAASPAVVKIETYSEVSYNNSNSLFNDPFFRQFFGDSYVPRQESKGQTELKQTGMGTGFFFDEAGYILTNQHVIGDATEIRVIVEGYDEPFIAELLGSSFDLDLAVIKLNEDIKFPTLEIGSSEDINIGDWVVAIGNPYGFDHTLTVGVISAKERPISISDESGERNYKNLLQTDASINPGNSGGPLINLAGQVIGINTAVSAQAQGIGFAIPTTTINEVLDYLKNNEEVPVEPIPFVGIKMSPLTEDMLEGTGLTKAEGVRVESIYYGTPAYKGGLNQFDIITQIDDQSIKSSEDLQKYIASKKVGDTVNMHVIRRGEKIVVPIEIGDQNHYNISQ